MRNSGEPRQWQRRFIWGYALITMLLLLAWTKPTVAGEDDGIPLVRDLQKHRETTANGKSEEQGKKGPRFPPKLGIEETWDNPASILSAKPLFYLESPNGHEMFQAMSESMLAAYLGEQKTQQFLRENPLTLASLFTDLPAQYADPNRLAVISAFKELTIALSDTPSQISLAAYPNENSGFELIFIADIGRNREEPFNKLETIRDAMRNNFPQLHMEEGERGKDFIDFFRNGESGLALGIVRNFIVVTTNPETASQLLKLAQGGEKDANLRATKAYGDMENRATEFNLRGFINLRSLRQEMKNGNLLDAQEMLSFASDLVGKGKTRGRNTDSGTIYYDLRVNRNRFRETLISPTRVNEDEHAGLPRRLQMICAPAPEKNTDETVWTTANIVPYQPEFFAALRVKPKAFLQLLGIKGNLFGRSEQAGDIILPDSVKTVQQQLKNHTSLLEGEVSIALLPKQQEETPWLIAMSLNSASEAQKVFMQTAPKQTEINGVRVFYQDDNLSDAQCWAVFANDTFKHLDSSLVFASSGKLMTALIDQATAISASFGKNNQDFKSLLKRLGRGNNFVWYYNAPAVANRLRNNFRILAKQYFPRAAASRLPPRLTKHITGIIGGAKITADRKTIRTSIISPIPIVPTLSSLLVLNMPRWIRDRSRSQMSISRLNLQNMWLKLQTYATSRGHFPNEHGAEGIGKVKALFTKLSKEKKAALFTSPAAVEFLGDDAENGSYGYVEGLLTTDEPSSPLIYEAGPWHYEYKNWISPPGDEESTETGKYLRWRLVLQLDGTIRHYTENEFQKRILPRIKAHE